MCHQYVHQGWKYSAVFEQSSHNILEVVFSIRFQIQSCIKNAYPLPNQTLYGSASADLQLSVLSLRYKYDDNTGGLRLSHILDRFRRGALDAWFWSFIEARVLKGLRFRDFNDRHCLVYKAGSR